MCSNGLLEPVNEMLTEAVNTFCWPANFDFLWKRTESFHRNPTGEKLTCDHVWNNSGTRTRDIAGRDFDQRIIGSNWRTDPKIIIESTLSNSRR